VKLTGVVGGAGFTIPPRVERFPNPARGGRERGEGIEDRPLVKFVHPVSTEGAEVHVVVQLDDGFVPNGRESPVSGGLGQVSESTGATTVAGNLSSFQSIATIPVDRCYGFYRF